MKKNNHIDRDGNVQMVDISDKAITHRKAIASGYISLSKIALDSIRGGISVNINFKIKEDRVECISEITCDGKTGVEIEALCAIQVSLLTIYDMCKYIDKSMIISEIKLVLKEGGKSGLYEAK